MPTTSKKSLSAGKPLKLVHVQTNIPKFVRDAIEDEAKKIDPAKPNFSLAFRKVTVEWYENRFAKVS